MKFKMKLSFILTVTPMIFLISGLASAQTDALFNALKNSQNHLVDHALRSRLARLADEAPVQFEYFSALAESTSPHAHEISRARYLVAPRTPFWEIISAWISLEPFEPSRGLIISQIAKIYAVPKIIPADVRRDDETNSHREERLLLVGQFLRGPLSNLRGVNTETLIHTLPLLLKVAAAPGRREFSDFQQTIKRFSGESDWNQIYFLIGLNATLAIIGELDSAQSEEALEVLKHFSVEAVLAVRTNDMLLWSDRVKNALQIARANHAERCVVPMTLNLF